jgi:hypothetical protein
MNHRSNRAEVRNPVLSLPAARRLREMPREQRDPIAALLLELGDDASRRAAEAWRKHKAPMAVYWKAVAVYARHLGRVFKRPEPQPSDKRGAA